MQVLGAALLVQELVVSELVLVQEILVVVMVVAMLAVELELWLEEFEVVEVVEFVAVGRLGL